MNIILFISIVILIIVYILSAIFGKDMEYKKIGGSKTSYTIRNYFIAADAEYRKKLIALLGKFLKGGIKNIDLKRASDKFIEDAIIKNAAADETKNKWGQTTDYRSSNRVRDIKEYLETAAKGGKEDIKFADIGAGSCEITEAIAKFLSAKKENAFAVDIKNYCSESAAQGCTFVQTDEFGISVEDAALDFVVAFQSLHHIEKIGGMLETINKKMRDGGLFIIREHDCGNEEMRFLIELEHKLYDSIENNNDEYYSKYRDRDEWNKIISAAGFEFIEYKEIGGKYNPTNYYYAVYKKSAGV